MIGRVAATAALVIALGPPSAIADTSAGAPLTLTPPPWLTTASPASTSTGTVATPRGDLPFTGDDLIPEAAAALVLIGAGVLIRIKW